MFIHFVLQFFYIVDLIFLAYSYYYFYLIYQLLNVLNCSYSLVLPWK